MSKLFSKVSFKQKLPNKDQFKNLFSRIGEKINETIDAIDPPPRFIIQKKVPENIPPWRYFSKHKLHERFLKKRMLKISNKSKDLTGKGVKSDFTFDFESHKPLARATIKRDRRLSKLREYLVPKIVTERNFWFGYFYKVYQIIEEGKEIAKQAPKKEEEFHSQKLKKSSQQRKTKTKTKTNTNTQTSTKTKTNTQQKTNKDKNPNNGSIVINNEKFDNISLEEELTQLGIKPESIKNDNTTNQLREKWELELIEELDLMKNNNQDEINKNLLDNENDEWLDEMKKDLENTKHN
ncbi:synapse-associated protein [Anaeramoeba flamelloides]|uniref:Synapse-associated protein n=1 Tax=Anaeramoeba flamelloides TaxID=1746091 RepID=A0ABQ8X1J7_9EUKA|nr:synapse-associated protein [Anaeramoeba flamelloides]